MNITLKKVELEDREILANLIEKYEYEFSQYNKKDVNKFELYGYQYLDCYWIEPNRWAYFIEVDNKLAGFVMVNDYSEVEDRKKGIGKKVFFMVADLHRGSWQLKRHPKNKTSVLFWDNAVDEYTNGKFELVKAYPNTEYEGGTLGNVFFFSH